MGLLDPANDDLMSCSSSALSTDTWHDATGDEDDDQWLWSKDVEALCRQQAGCKGPALYLDGVQAGGLTPQQRAGAVDSLIAAAAELRLTNDSLFLGVACLDRYLSRSLSKKPTQPSLLQPVAITCLWLAAKFEESYSSELLTGTNFSRHMLGPSGQRLGNAPAALQLLLLLEKTVLAELEWRLAAVLTTRTFKQHLLQQLASSCGSLAPRQLEALCCMASYLTEAALLEYQLLAVRPDQLAAAAVLVAALLLGAPSACDAALAELTGWTSEELARPIEWLLALHAALHSALCLGRPYAVSVKYSDAAACTFVAPITATTDARLQR